MERAAERVGMPLDAFLEAANREPFELINGRRWPLMPEVAGEALSGRTCSVRFTLMNRRMGLVKVT